MQDQWLGGARLLLEDGLVTGQAVRIAAGRIREIGAEPPGAEKLPPGSILAPGFIDIQVNGGGGVLLNDAPDQDSMRRIVAAHRQFGTTGLLPTLITDKPDRLHALAAALRNIDLPGVLGAHFEGPFISPQRAGIHDPAYIRPIAAEDIETLLQLAQSRPDLRVVVTLAPECVPVDAIARLSRGGVIVCAGHTAADPDCIAAALAAGLRGFTHLFNAMPPLRSRDPGPVPAALVDRQSWCGIIADGVHVHPAMLRMAVAAKPPGKVMLVTDAMPPLGTADQQFQLGARPITRQNGRLTGADGTLAGADLDMAAAVRNAIALLGADLPQALRMASTYPADFLRLQDRGRIAPGYAADMVLLSAELTVLGSWRAGIWERQA